MAADIEFNVRNGMTVGASKYMVLDVNGALSARGFTLLSGQILSGGDDVLQVVDQQLVQPVDNKANTMGAASADWNNTYTTVNSKSGYWETAFDWGDHSAENYATNADIQTAISDLISGAPAALDTLNELASALGDDADFATTVTNSIATKWTQDDDKINNWDVTYTAVTANSGEWNQAYGWGDHASENYLTSIDIVSADNWSTAYTAVTANSGEWNQAYGWGDHATQNYATASDIVSADNWSSAYTAVTANSGEWNQAYGWGDHATQNYATASDIVSADNWSSAYTAVTANSADWDSAYGWGDHATQNYLVASDIVSADNWSSAYTAVTANSADWAAHTDVTDLNSVVDSNSANWQVTYATVTANSADWSSGGIEDISSATDTDITTPAKGEVLIYQSNTNKWTNKTDRASIESMYNYANTNFFSELSYDGTGKLTGVDVWVTSSKSTKLYERTFTYDASDNLTTIVTKDVQGGSTRHTLTKTMTYDGNNNLTSVDRAYT